MVKARKYIVKRRFHGWPKRGDFEIVEYELSSLKDGEVLVKVEWISVDPYLRVINSNNFGIKHPFLSAELPYDQMGCNIGTVIESRNHDYPVGTKMVSHEGWRDYYVIRSDHIQKPYFKETLYKMPDLQGLSNSLAIGAVGMPGVTAYFGFLEFCKPEVGETVVVSGAAGAVGSIVVQIAKIKGCKVVAFTDSDEKVKWLEEELGVDKAYDYKTVNITEALKEAAPNGVDSYFDNVGGEVSTLIMEQMNCLGRIAVSGMISTYNNEPSHVPVAPLVPPAIVLKQLTLRGFLVLRWNGRWFEAFEQLVTWIKQGQIRIREHVTEGFENIYDAFVGMMQGDNIGKAIVKV